MKIYKENKENFAVTFKFEKTAFELSAQKAVQFGSVPVGVCVINILKAFNKLHITGYDYDAVQNIFSEVPKCWTVDFGTTSRAHNINYFNPQTEEEFANVNQVWPQFLDCLKTFTDKYKNICGVCFPAWTSGLQKFFTNPETRSSIENATGFKYSDRNGYVFYFRNPASIFPTSVREVIQIALDSNTSISDQLRQDLEKVLPIV